jgi:hypothetical protein
MQSLFFNILSSPPDISYFINYFSAAFTINTARSLLYFLNKNQSNYFVFLAFCNLYIHIPKVTEAARITLQKLDFNNEQKYNNRQTNYYFKQFKTYLNKLAPNPNLH